MYNSQWYSLNLYLIYNISSFFQLEFSSLVFKEEAIQYCRENIKENDYLFREKNISYSIIIKISKGYRC